MPVNKLWNHQDFLKLYELKQSGKSYSEIADLMGRSLDSIEIKFRRTNWEVFLKDPSTYIEKHGQKKKWDKEEILRLDQCLKQNMSYQEISLLLGRSFSSVERQAKRINWTARRLITESNANEASAALSNEISSDISELNQDLIIGNLVNAILVLARSDVKLLEAIGEKEFLKRVNFEKKNLPIPFNLIKGKALQELENIGCRNPEEMAFGQGRYLVIGDSHGKYTKRAMFALLDEFNKYLKPTKIIHVGHILDDDNDISYDWGKFKNLIILAKVEELRNIQSQRNKYDFKYDVVREAVSLGDLVVQNQDMISDYVRSPLSSLDAETWPDQSVVNCHRLEFSSRCSHDSRAYIASPGCLCENHIVRTIKQIDFTDGRVVKQAFHEGFGKYRKMKHTCKYWENGLLVVTVDKDGGHTIVPCIIQKTSKGFTTSYFDKMISSEGVFEPQEKIFVNADIHSPDCDMKILDIQEQICKDYKPTKQVNLGDTLNCTSLNHHLIDRGIPILDIKLLDEAQKTHYVLARINKWAKESYLIYGNHERFAVDFTNKYPQLADFLNFRFLCSLDSLNYNLTELRNVLKIGSMKFIHGELRMYGQPGSKLEKASRTFGKYVFIGHIHKPEIRFGCYSIGLSGLMDQDYNEVNASNWMHGFGLCNQFEGKSWPTTVAIVNYKCLIGNKTYRPVNIKTWVEPKYNVKLTYALPKDK